MKQLTKKAEELLREILDHRLENGKCDTNYWKNKFEEYSVEEDAIVRSFFKELREADMISVSWYDDYPEVLLLLERGISYFEEKDCEAIPQTTSYVNNFYSIANNVQIQQGSVNSTQKITVTDDSREYVKQLIEIIKKYDSVLEVEYSTEAANLRKSCSDLEQAVANNKDTFSLKKIVAYIRDLSVNAGGGLIATGIIEMTTKILG